VLGRSARSLDEELIIIRSIRSESVAHLHYIAVPINHGTNVTATYIHIPLLSFLLNSIRFSVEIFVN
jgi:hypothetical protein